MTKTVLITGAFGNLGLMCVHQALQMGYQVRCFDLDNKHSQRLSRQLGKRVDILLGDIQDTGLQQLMLQGVDAVIHNASVLPPVTENNPELAWRINVDACRSLIGFAEQCVTKPVFVFPSSVTVFGLPEENESPRNANDAVAATDNYTAHKLAIETTLSESGLPWVVLRVGVAVDARTLATDRKTFRQLIDVNPDNPLEYVHPKDVAYAMCRAVSTEAAIGRTLLIGGGQSCQVTQRTFLSIAFESLGIPLPASVHGSEKYYTHWMDTTESQRLLGFQRHSIEDYRQEMAARLKVINSCLAPFRWLIRPLLIRILKLL